MGFADNNIYELLSRSKSALLGGADIFTISEDNFPHGEIGGQYLDAGTLKYDTLIEKLRKA